MTSIIELEEIIKCLSDVYKFEITDAIDKLTEKELLPEKMMKTNIITKGTGAGGANTNKNGLPYEKLTDLESKYTIISSENHYKNINFTQNGKVFKMTKQSHLFKCMNDKMNKEINQAHGCKNPDECYINDKDKNIFILEKKFQQTSGSVCEKIQSPDFKIWQYSRTFPEYNIIYIYCLSDWFNINCKAEIEYLEYKKIPVFWGDSENYKNNIIDFIINYK